MPEFEFEFNNQDTELVISQQASTFGDTDYIRLSIYPAEAINNIVRLPGTNDKAIFYSSLYDADTNGFDINVSPFGSPLNQITTKRVGGNVDSTGTPSANGKGGDFKIYRNTSDNSIYIKPNEILNDFGLPQGNYKIQIDFLNQVSNFIAFDNIDAHHQFIIKQISTTRKEVRVKLLNTNISSEDNIITNLKNEFNNNEPEFYADNNPQSDTFGQLIIPNPNYKYQFKHVLNIGTGDHIPIMNYTFDAVTDGKENQSIILKLYDSLPISISNLSHVTIEKEVLTTQIQDTFYFSDVPPVFFGDGLQTDFSYNYINPDNNDIGFQNYNDLTGSFSDIQLDNLISQSQYNYPNLNTDFTKFENHTFFGSAKKKLENFQTKVKTIQGYYSDISSSLVVSGSISGDSTFIIEKRKNLFKKIEEEFRNFTPYERFLYYDGQNSSTASAPGIGKNYAHTTPLHSSDSNYEELTNFDGFNVVYKNSNLGSISSNRPNITQNTYKAQDKPFFNYSGSVYLSFLMKGTKNLILDRINNNHLVTGNISNGFFLPHDTMYTGSVMQPNTTGSEYRRFIFEASSSYFVPNTDSLNSDMNELVIPDDFAPGSTKITILHGSVKTGSRRIKDTTNLYPTTATSMSAGIPFFGSIMPAGDLFNIGFTSGSALTQSFITDVKVSLKNPTNTLPFDTIYQTTSTEWTDWYNGMITSAETFDTDNIHSFENNLPVYIQESSDYQDMKDFLNLQGEQYDLIRNHIDSMGTLNKRGYKKTNSPPDNTLPMLLSNMGWEAINPFSGSLTDSLGKYLTGVTSVEDVKNNTWRKTLNNLIYIYKSKGTKNAVRGLLNTYGYPPDVLQFQEFGGSTKEPFEGNLASGPNISDESSNDIDIIDTDLNHSTDTISFKTRKEKLYYLTIGKDRQRILNTQHYRNNTNVDTIELVYKHVKSTNEQKLLSKQSHATSNQAAFDLRLIPSSDGLSSSLEFRLNNTNTASLDIASNAVSMSTPYIKFKDGQLWNVMIQRMSSSVSGSGTNEYRLFTGFQENSAITTLSTVSMSVSGGLTNTYITGGDVMTGSVEGRGYFANQNWVLTGSYSSVAAQGNLSFGGRGTGVAATTDGILTGSIAEVRGWKTALSASRFKQHTLNKFSTVGNTLNSHKNDLVYHYRLNENYSSASISSSAQVLNLVDSSPTTVYQNYNVSPADSSFFTSSLVYGFDTIEMVTLTTLDNSLVENDNRIIIEPQHKVVGDLSPTKPGIRILFDSNTKKPTFNTSPKLELYRSPQDFVNNFIVDKISGYNLETLYGSPTNYYSQSYNELDEFRTNFYKDFPISVDVNKFIRTHESMFNYSISEGLKKIIPARSTFSDENANFGVEVKPTILEKQKYENEEHSVEVNPNTFTSSVLIIENTEFKQSSLTSTYETIKEGEVFKPTSASGSLELPITTSISLGNTYVTSSGYLRNAHSQSLFKNHFQVPFLQPGNYTASIVNPYTMSLNTLPIFNGTGIVLPKTGSIDYASRANKSFVNIHKNWGTSSSNVHHINFAAPTSSYGTFNTYDIETKFVFHTIGDNEYYSASMGTGSSQFEDTSRFYNQLVITDGPAGLVTNQPLYGKLSPVLQHSAHKVTRGIEASFGVSGEVVGKRMGKTRFMRLVTNFNGINNNRQLILPNNHVLRFSQPFKEQMIKGAQNTNPGFLPVQKEDYSTASFYRVNVTGGEAEVIVRVPGEDDFLPLTTIGE